MAEKLGFKTLSELASAVPHAQETVDKRLLNE